MGKKILQAFLFIGTPISLYFVPWLIVKAWILPLPDSLQGQLNQALDHGFDGIILHIDQPGKPPVQLAAGYHNRNQQQPARPDALYKIASISKLYDVVALTKLAAQGTLSLDSSLANYLPELSLPNANRITLRHLVQHRSGLPNFTDAPGFWGGPHLAFDECLALIEGQPALFEPGSDSSYCNTNYLLLDRIMQEALGERHFDFLQREVLLPLGLTSTYASLAEAPYEAVMSGYHKGYEPDLKDQEHGMVASAADIAAFVRALNEGTLFTEEEAALYPYVYGHGGWVPGYQSFVSYSRKDSVVMVALYNTTDSDLYNWNLSQVVNGRLLKIYRRD